jgi:hypothetical protein
MITQVNLTRPTTLEAGAEYLLLEYFEEKEKPTLTPVTFASYDPCPAFVIVRTSLGKKWRCPRESIFAKAYA